MLIHEVLEYAAADRPDAVALIVPDRRLTFAELVRRVEAMATLLEGRVAPGDRVVMVSDNHLDVVVALYAVPMIGGILVPGNTRHTADELMGLVAATDPVLVLAAPDHLERLHPSLVQRSLIQRSGSGPAAQIVSLGGAHPDADFDLTERLDLAADQERPGTPPTQVRAPTPPGACAWMIHTSGTTGQPKGVMLTHRSLLAAVTNTAIARPLADDDVYLFPFPLFHVAAYNVLHAHLRRVPVVLVPKFDAGHILRLIEAEQVTSCSLAPTMIAMLLDHPDRRAHSLDRLRQISYGASAMPLDLLRRVQGELPHCGLAQGYGMTELSGNAAFLPPAGHRRAAADAPQLLAAAGRPGPLVEIRLVDDGGATVPQGGTGEIEVRGDQVCAGYWQDPDATAAAFDGGWLRTGDIGRFDEEGYLYVVDRKKDLIITGGENVASREVEDVLGEHPAIASVAVVGVPDDRWGETVCAVVVAVAGAELSAEQLIAWSDGRLAGFKRPRVVVLVPELPVNASGKVDKRAVREMALGR